MTDRIGDEMSELGRGVEAAVRIPPYDVVVARLHRRRRRRAGVGGLVLAALVTAGVVVLPQVADHRTGGVQPASQVTVAPPTGRGTLSLSDVSYDGDEDGLLLGRRCGEVCHDVVLPTTDRGAHYGPEVALPGDHRYVAAGPGLDVAYAPGLALSRDGAATWSELDPPLPVADVVFSASTMTVLVTPSGRPAELFTGPETVTAWSQLKPAGTVPGSDDSARLVLAGSEVLVVSTRGTPRVATLGAGGWTRRDLGLCAPGSQASVAAVDARTWWVACRDQETGGRETVAITTDAGATFTAVAPPPTTELGQSIAAVSARTAYLFGGSALFVTTDGGGSWQTALAHPGLGAPHIPPHHGGGDIWVLAPGANTVWRQLAPGGFEGYQAT